MGRRLTKLEEAKLKKPPRVDVLDEEEGEVRMKGTKLIMKGTSILKNSQ